MSRHEPFLRALLDGDAEAAETAIRAELDAGSAPVEVHATVIAAAMHEIGTRWECGELSVADEHLATALSHRSLALLYESLLSAPPRSRERVLLAATEGEQHVLGLRMVGDVLEGAGFEVIFLGADVPHEVVIAAVRRHRPRVVGLSTSIGAGEPLLRAVEDLAELDFPVGVVVGGPAVPAALHDLPTVNLVNDVSRALEATERALKRPLVLPRERRARPPSRAELPAVPREPTTPERELASRLAASVAGMADVARLQTRRVHELRRIAFEDPLTGLWNRRAFDDRFSDLLDDAEARPLTLAVVDVDDFKPINDVHGHEVGDEVLVRIAAAVRGVLRVEDFVARIGGDEFAVLMPGTPAREAADAVKRVQQALGELEGPGVTVSIGLAEVGRDRREAFLAADQALYAVKRAGGGGVVLDAAAPLLARSYPGDSSSSRSPRSRAAVNIATPPSSPMGHSSRGRSR